MMSVKSSNKTNPFFAGACLDPHDCSLTLPLLVHSIPLIHQTDFPAQHIVGITSTVRTKHTVVLTVVL